MTSTTILSHFANFKLAGDRVVRDAVLSIQADKQANPSPMRSFFSAQGASYLHPSSRMRRRRRHPGRSTRFSSRSTSRVHAMSDADLEAELAARRAARTRERDRYAKAMRSEKLSALEGELMRLRNEISRLDHSGGVPLGGGTPPTSRWEPLGGDHRSRSPALRNHPGPRTGSLATPPVLHAGQPLAAQQPSGPPGVPPPPPPPPLGGPPPPPPPPGADDEPFDPEKQKREKAERQRRREQKRKEREAAKKPLTLAEIIRAAGPDPAKRLKPKGSTALEDPNAEGEPETKDEVKELGAVKDSLKAAEPVKKDDGEQEGKKDGKDSKGATDERKENSEVEIPAPSKDEGENARKPEPIEKEMKLNGPTSGEGTNSKTTVTKSDSRETDEKPAAKQTESNANSTAKDTVSEAPPQVKSQPSEGDTAILSSGSTKDTNSAEKESNGPAAVTEEESKPPSPEETAASALTAISALSAKLPEKKQTTAPAAKPSRRLSLAERRKMRKATNSDAPTPEDEQKPNSDAPDVLTSPIPNVD